GSTNCEMSISPPTKAAPKASASNTQFISDGHGGKAYMAAPANSSPAAPAIAQNWRFRSRSIGPDCITDWELRGRHLISAAWDVIIHPTELTPARELPVTNEENAAPTPARKSAAERRAEIAAKRAADAAARAAQKAAGGEAPPAA